MKVLLTICTFLFSAILFAQEALPYTQQEVIYGRKDGMALTMVILKPEKPNGKAVISLVSGGYFSNYSWLQQPNYLKRSYPFLNSGYTVFITIHSSNPQYAIPHYLKDIQRAIQFVRYNAASYGIDSNNLAITGHSSGGHLALLAATSDDIKNPKSKDSISKMSSKIQAVVALSPPTDLLNWGVSGQTLTALQIKYNYGAFKYTNWDTTLNAYVAIENPAERRRIDSLMSPSQIISYDAPPVYIICGSDDKAVPIQQSKTFIGKYSAMKLESVLVLKEGQDHNLTSLSKDDYKNIVDWLDKKLKVMR